MHIGREYIEIEELKPSEEQKESEPLNKESHQESIKKEELKEDDRIESSRILQHRGIGKLMEPSITHDEHDTVIYIIIIA